MTDQVDITRPRYDQSTYSGRLWHFVSVTSPLTLFYPRSAILDAETKVKEYDAQVTQAKAAHNPLLVSSAKAQEYWKAKQLVQSSTHADTGEIIPLPFRMSAFVPTNLVLVVGMLMPGQSLGTTIFWQWANQSLNTCVNYANANKAGGGLNMKELMGAYGAATSAAVGISVGLKLALRDGSKLHRALSPTGRNVASRLVPFLAVGTASSVNVAASRYREVLQGIPVYRSTKEGDVEVGTSVTAGRRAVGSTALSRVIMNFPILAVPPALMTALVKLRVVPAAGIKARLAEVAVVGLSLGAFLPPAIAIFPQRAAVPVSQLEFKFHDLKDDQGEAVSTLFYNKGL